MREIKEENSSIEMEKRSRNWIAVLFYVYLHVLGVIGLYVLLTKAKWLTLFYFLFLVVTSSIGLTIGAHRLYAHQTFVATSQLRFFLVLVHTLAGVGTIYNWAFWHRVHHKHHGTEKDPYNHKKGFLYAHVFSNLLSAPNIKPYEREIDMRDVDSDGYIWIQKKFYWILVIVLGLVSVYAPVRYWEESLSNSYLIIGAARLMIMTNISWLINSALLVWGLKRGDKFPVDDNSVFFLYKSYWLNYHYMVPWDWKNDEFGKYETGFATFIIKMLYELGLINEMKTVSVEDVRDKLYQIATSDVTLDEALRQMHDKSKENAYKQKLIYYH